MTGHPPSATSQRHGASLNLALPYAEWSAADRAIFDTATASGDLLDPGGPAESWSPATRQSIIDKYSRWLGWLKRRGWLDPGIRPADRVNPERVKAYVDDLGAEFDGKKLSSETVYAYARGLLNFMIKAAPDREWAWLRTAAENLRKVARPSRDKRLQVRPAAELYEFGKELMLEANEPDAGTPLERAVRARDGLIITILAARAPRRGCLAGMVIGRHLQKIGDRFWLIFSADETKQGREAHDFLPPDLVPYIERYLSQHRKVLASQAKGPPDDKSMWLTERGRRLGAPAIHHQVTLRTKMKFGVAIPPHRFRDCLATSIAYELPANVGIGCQMLHHADLDMIERHYIQAEARVAFTKLHKNLDELRRELGAYNGDELWTIK